MYELERDQDTWPLAAVCDQDTLPLVACRDTTQVDLFADETGCNHPFFLVFAVLLYVILFATVCLIALSH